MLDEALDEECPRWWPTSEAAPGCRASPWPSPVRLPGSTWSRRRSARPSSWSASWERLELSNAAVLRARAEELPGRGAGSAYGAVVVRAVAPLATLVEYAGPLLAEGGRLLAWKGAGIRTKRRPAAALRLGSASSRWMCVRVTPYSGQPQPASAPLPKGEALPAGVPPPGRGCAPQAPRLAGGFECR